MINTYLRYFCTLLLEVDIYYIHDCNDMVIYIFYNTSRKVFIVLISRTEVENQFIKGFEGLKTDWWGKYTSGILIEANEHGIIHHCLMSKLHGWMEEYNFWLFPWLCVKALHATICSVSHYLSQSLFIFCELEGSILFKFLVVWYWNDCLLHSTPRFYF